MSSRHLKKVYGESLEGVGNKTSLASSDEDVPSTLIDDAKGFGRRNPYEMLTVEEDSDKGDEANVSAGEQDLGECGEQDSSPTSAQLEKGRIRKKRKGKKSKNSSISIGMKVQPAVSSGTSQLHGCSNVNEQVSFAASSSSKANDDNKDLFTPDQRFLNTEFELRQIFGASVINRELGKSGKRSRKRYRALGKIISPKDKWPSVGNSGISMSLLEPKDIGVTQFKFEHSAHYQEIQKQFLNAINTNDPENILRIVQVNPGHVDSQIQLSEISKHSEDNQVAAELVEIALHVLESAFDSRFSISSTNCRLDYKYQENRAFHILLYKHINFVSQRACHRSALEMSKILLNLDVSDPLCVTLALDFFAIKAGECLWLTKVYNSYNGTRNLSQLPNWSYSIALSLFLLSIGGENGYTSAFSRKKSEYLSDLSEAEKESHGKQSDELLQYSFLMFPTVVIPLMEKCGIKCDEKFKNHYYFNGGAQNSSPEPLRLLTDLYVWRCWHLWKNPAILNWVEKNANIVKRIIETKDPVLSDYAQKRRRRYQEGTTPRNVLRHIFLIGEKEVSLRIPQELTKDAILAHDPLPPKDAIDIYRREERRIPPPVDSQPAGILNALLQSFRMELNIADPVNQNVPVAGAAGVAHGEETTAGAFHRSVSIFIDAMRNLLAVATPDGNHARSDADDTSSDEDL